MPKLPYTYLHRITIDGTPLPLVVNARSQAAVRDHFVLKHMKIERLTPEEAFAAGMRGATIEAVADPALDAPAPDTPVPSVSGLFDAPSVDAGTTPTESEDASCDPKARPGYVSAQDAASAL